LAIPSEQAPTAALLRRLAGAAATETPVSAVFQGTEEVWKLRKAVRLSFLDFTSLEMRRRMAEREFELNRRAAPGLYRGVAAIVRRGGGTPCLEGEGEVVDWVVRMARLPANAFLERRLPGGLDAVLLDGLGDAVAAWHAGATPVARDHLAAMRRAVEGNAEAALAAGLPREWVERSRAAMLEALGVRVAWLAGRAAGGFVRRGHGDLHLGNICLWQGRPVPFDALEFDEDLATIDVGYDLAFLLMDLDLRAGRAEANRVLNRYVARTGDVGLCGGLAPFLALRAVVRAHVEARAGHAAAAARYRDAAMGYLAPTVPVVVAIGGLPGVGKSTLARALAPGLGPAPGALVLRSDELRKRRHGVAPECPLPQAAYAETVSRAVLAELCQGVASAAAAGHAVVADATFLDAADRAAVARAAGEAHFVGIWLRAPLGVLEARVVGRSGDASDADVAVLRRAAAADPGPMEWPEVEAADAAAALAAVCQRLAVRAC
jgi:hypothetical protein